MSAFVPTRYAGVSMPSMKSISRQGLLTALAVAILALMLGGVFFSRLLWPPRAELAEIRSDNVSNPSVLIASARAESRLGYLTVTGSFTNVTSSNLRNVEAVVEYFDDARRLMKVDSALVEMPIVAPRGDTSFEVHSRDSGNFAYYRIRFRQLLGGDLPSARAAL